MKRLLCLLFMLFCLTGCQPMDGGDPDSYEIPADEYVWEDVGATILLPEGTMEHCYVEAARDSDAEVIWFQLIDSGDSAFWLRAYEKGVEEPMEEQLGVFTLGETDTHILQVMTSTCGTLNREEVRPVWEKLRQGAAEMTEENIILH